MNEREQTIKKLAKEAKKVIRDAGASIPLKTTDEEVLNTICPCNRVIFEEAMIKLGKIEDELFNKGIYLK